MIVKIDTCRLIWIFETLTSLWVLTMKFWPDFEADSWEGWKQGFCIMQNICGTRIEVTRAHARVKVLFDNFFHYSLRQHWTRKLDHLIDVKKVSTVVKWPSLWHCCSIDGFFKVWKDDTVKILLPTLDLVFL